MNIIKKSMILLLNKSTILVGGQAVIEGVMMRVPGFYATAVRNPEGEIKFRRQKFDTLVKKNTVFNIPIIRGSIHLYESLKIGMKTLQWSADIALPEEKNKKQNKFIDLLMNLVTIFFALGLFVILPIITADYFFNKANSPFMFNLISGGIRIVLFLIYLIGISFLNDIKRLFQYHGAEHRTVYTFEAGLPLEIKETHQFPTQHPRCGTSFLFIVMIVAILSFGIIDTIALFYITNLEPFIRIIFHIPLIPVVGGIGYEVLKLTAKHRKNILFQLLSAPGIWLQLITTKKPDDEQAEVALEALKCAFGDDIPDYIGKEHIAEAIA